VANVATLVKEALEIGGIKGLFHWAGADSLNRWEMGHRIANSFNVPEDLLQRTIARNYPQFKDRPLKLTMDSYKLKALVETEPEPFENQLKGLLIPNT
jgi:dTDP-4-dehydrorhamnose reductase